VITCPLDVIKTRVQVGAAAGGVEMGYLQTAKDLVRHDGVLGGFRGATARVLWLAPASALNVTLYEMFSENLGGSGLR